MQRRPPADNEVSLVLWRVRTSTANALGLSDLSPNNGRGCSLSPLPFTHPLPTPPHWKHVDTASPVRETSFKVTASAALERMYATLTL